MEVAMVAAVVIEVWTDTAKLTDMETDEIWSEKVKCSSNMKPRFRAE